MELILNGFPDWVIDTAHNNDGIRWADVYHKIGPRFSDWQQFGAFVGETSVAQALDLLIEEGLEMTEDQVCGIQEDLPETIYIEPVEQREAANA